MWGCPKNNSKIDLPIHVTGVQDAYATPFSSDCDLCSWEINFWSKFSKCSSVTREWWWSPSKCKREPSHQHLGDSESTCSALESMRKIAPTSLTILMTAGHADCICHFLWMICFFAFFSLNQNTSSKKSKSMVQIGQQKLQTKTINYDICCFPISASKSIFDPPDLNLHCRYSQFFPQFLDISSYGLSVWTWRLPHHWRYWRLRRHESWGFSTGQGRLPGLRDSFSGLL